MVRRRTRRAGDAAGNGEPVDYGPLADWVGFNLRMAQAASFQAFSRLAREIGTRPGRFATLMLIGRNQAGAAQILGSLPIAIILLLFIIASTWHMKIGMQVVIEDYVHSEKLKLACVMANNFFSTAVALASIYAILKLSSGV